MKTTGKHKQNHLSAMRVRSVTEAGRYGDGNGLYLIVDPSEAKRWVLRIVVQGTRRDIGLGGTHSVTLAEAREEAVRLRKIAKQGGDPLAERKKEKRIVLTFEEAAREVHKEQSATWRNDKHKQQWINTLSVYVFPTFGSLRVDNIGTPEVHKVLNPIWLTKPETARRLRQRIHKVFQWAKAKGFRSGDNPVDGMVEVLPKQPANDNHHPSLPYKNVPKFIKDLRSDYKKTNKVYLLSFELLILTATRTTDARNAMWQEINLEDKVWSIPDDRHKSGKVFRLPLASRQIEILKEAQKLSEGSPYVFINPDTRKPYSENGFLNQVKSMEKRNLLDIHISPHGFRSSCRDWAEERTNFPYAVKEAFLSHKESNKTVAAYKRTDHLEKRRELMDVWTKFATEEHGEVITIHAKKS